MDYLPIHINLHNKPCLVLGAGTVALRKIKMLLKTGAQVTCVGKEINRSIIKLQRMNKLKLIQVDLLTTGKHMLEACFVKNYTLVISTTGNSHIAQKVFTLCDLNKILINTVDNQSLCNFISPAIVNRNPIIVSISSGGTAPVLVRNIRKSIEKLLPSKLGLLASKAGSLRAEVKINLKSMSVRKSFWERFFNSTYSEDLLNERPLPSNKTLIHNISSNIRLPGEVALVGAGPGDPDLLTIKALNAIQKADIIFYDRLVSPEVLELVRRDAELVSVGKSQGHHSVPQSQINELLVRHAQQGQRVVRLKGGDPFVFGRGGEEISSLVKHQIKYQIIPGITAAIGCSAYAGIPLTHRDYAQNVLFITAHCQQSKDTLDWKSYARAHQTLAVYMGLLKADYLASQLIHYGKNPQTPVALIENGTSHRQRVIRGTLQKLQHLVKQHKVISPTLIIIGEVAALHDDFAWFKPHINQNTEVPINQARIVA